MKALSNFAYSLQARQNDRLFDEDLKQLKGTALRLVCCALLIQDGFFEMLSPEIQNNWAIKRLIKKEKGQVSNIAQQLGSISQTKKINNFPRKGLVLGDKEQQATFVEDNVKKLPYLCLALIKEILANSPESKLEGRQTIDFFVRNCDRECLRLIQKCNKETVKALNRWFDSNEHFEFNSQSSYARHLFIWLFSSQSDLCSLALITKNLTNLQQRELLATFKDDKETKIQLCQMMLKASFFFEQSELEEIKKELEPAFLSDKQATFSLSLWIKDKKLLLQAYSAAKKAIIEAKSKPSFLDFFPFLDVMPSKEKAQVVDILNRVSPSEIATAEALLTVRKMTEIWHENPEFKNQKLSNFYKSTSLGFEINARKIITTLKELEGANKEIKAAAFVLFKHRPAAQLRIVNWFFEGQKASKLIAQMLSGNFPSENPKKLNAQIKAIRYQIENQPYNFWLTIKLNKATVAGHNNFCKSIFIETAETLLKKRLPSNALRTLLIQCVDARMESKAFLTARKLLNEHEATQTGWLFGQLSLLSPIPRSIASQILNAPKKIEFSGNEAVIFDPGYDFQAGHHENNNLAAAAILRQAGYKDVMLSTRNDSKVSAETSDAMKVSRNLLTNAYLHNSKKLQPEDIFALNDAFYLDLATHTSGYPKAIFFHSMRATMVSGLVSWISEAPKNHKMSVIIGIIEFDFLKDADISMVCKTIIGTSMSKLERMKNVDFLIYGETNTGLNLLREFSETSSIKVPYLAAITKNQEPASPKFKEKTNKNETLTFGFLGATRQDKGLDKLINQLDEIGKIENRKWVIQVDLPLLRKIDPATADTIINMIKARRDISFITKPMSSRHYNKTLQNLDVVVLPYDLRYANSGSGVLFEAIAYGKEILISDIPNLISEIEEMGAAHRVVNFEDRLDFLAAIKEAKNVGASNQNWTNSRQFRDFLTNR